MSAKSSHKQPPLYPLHWEALIPGQLWGLSTNGWNLRGAADTDLEPVCRLSADMTRSAPPLCRPPAAVSSWVWSGDTTTCLWRNISSECGIKHQVSTAKRLFLFQRVKKTSKGNKNVCQWPSKGGLWARCGPQVTYFLVSVVKMQMVAVFLS